MAFAASRAHKGERDAGLETGITQDETLDTPPSDEPGKQDLSPITGSIPAEWWTEQTETDVRQFIESEIFLCQGERGELMQDFKRYQTVYMAPPNKGPKNFPIRNASNLVVSLAKEMVNVITAQLVQTTLTTRPFWIMEAMAAEWDYFTNDIERFLDIAAERDLHLDTVAVTWILEAVKIGTSILQLDYEVDSRKTFEYNESGKKFEPKERKFHDGPLARHVAIEDFFIRLYETDIQRARWCGKRMRMGDAEINDKIAIGKFETGPCFKMMNRNDELEGEDEEAEIERHQMNNAATFDPITDPVTTERNAATHTTPTFPNEYEIFEIWLTWDIDKDGRSEEIVVYYNVKSRQILAKRFNPYWDCKRPFVALIYFPIEHRFYGDGVCAQVEEFQKEISAIHNQRMDNATMANLKMIIKKRMLTTLKPGDALWTGKIIEANDIFNDIREFTMSEIYPSTVNNEQMTRTLAERVSGAYERQSMPVTRTTATAQIALLQEQAKRFDMTVRNIRTSMTEVGQLTLNRYFQYGTLGKAKMWLGDRGKIVDAVFKLPERVIEIGVGIKASAPTSQENKETQRQGYLSMFNLLTQMYTQLLQMAQTVAPAALPEVARGMVKSAYKFMFNVLESFNVSDPDEVLSALLQLEQALPAPAAFPGSPQADSRGADSAEVLARLGGLEDLIRQVGADAQGRADVSDGFRRSGRSERVSASQGIFGGSPADNGRNRAFAGSGSAGTNGRG